jgi:hypothetical protein
MIRAENAYYVIAVPPTKHIYTYSDIAFNTPSSLVSPIADSSLLTLLSTGYNGILWGEYTDSRAVYEEFSIETTDGSLIDYEQHEIWAGAWQLYRNGASTGIRSFDGEKIQLCVRTDTIWKTADGYAAEGRIFYKVYSRNTGWQVNSLALPTCKLAAQVWEQTEKRHVVTMSG